jgi:hypothetical protein
LAASRRLIVVVSALAVSRAPHLVRGKDKRKKKRKEKM